MKFSKKYKIYNFYCINGRARLPVLIDLFLETSGAQSDSLGQGSNDLSKQNLTWMIYKWNIKIYDYPRFDQEVEVQTWASKFEKLQAKREFQLYWNGRLMMEATAVFLIVDTIEKKPVVIPKKIAMAYPIVEEEIFSKMPRRISQGKLLTRKYFEIRPWDIDLNLHVNNVTYIQWVLQSLPKEVLESEAVTEFSIHYMKEIRDQNQIKVESFKEENGISFEITGEALSARAWCDWKKH